MPPFFSPTIPLRIHFPSLYVRLYILAPTLTPIYFFYTLFFTVDSASRATTTATPTPTPTPFVDLYRMCALLFFILAC